MKLLILGGTVFVGRHLIEAAVERGHEVTLFNRGLHNAELYPEVERLRGEREGDLAPLRGRSWDAVIDTSGYLPSNVRAAASVLAEAVGQYVFISSLSVYAQFSEGMDESAPLATITEEQLNEAEAIKTTGRASAATYGSLYGPLKARCEAEAEDAMPGRVLIVRPGLIVGPHDYSDRFTYWVERVAEGGEVLAPGRPERRVKFVDVRDLSDWVVRMVEANRNGVFNINGPDYDLSMGELLEKFVEVSGSDARFVWVSESFLLENGVKPWTEMPLWIPEQYERLNHAGLVRALGAGLTIRPLEETVRDTLEWKRAEPAELRAGLRREREVELLALWHQAMV